MQLSSQAPELLAQSKRKAELHTDVCTELKANRKCQGQKRSTNIPLLVSARLRFVETTMHTHPWAESRQAHLWWSTPQYWHHILQAHIHTVIPGVTHIPTTTSSRSPSSLEQSDIWTRLWISWWLMFGTTFPLTLSGSSSTWRAVVIWAQS